MRKLQRMFVGFLIMGVQLGFFLPSKAARAAGGYLPVNLVSDIPGVARRSDPNLVNAWGIVITPTGKIWISDNGTGVSTIYSTAGVPQTNLIVTIPSPPGDTNPAAPTGIELNSSSNFVVTGTTTSGPSIFLFATEDGTVAGWNPAANPTNAILAVDNSMSGTGAVYKGIAPGTSGGSNYVYVTNFRSGSVEIYDGHFNFVRSFTDAAAQSNGFTPFGIRNVGGQLLVTFAVQNGAKHDDVAGAGNGFVDVFNTDGTMVKQLIAHGALNSPWGLALAPKNFGKFSGALLVGNFGDGSINAFNATSGALLGQLAFPNGDPIQINGLWGLTFGTITTAADNDDHGDHDRDDWRGRGRGDDDDRVSEQLTVLFFTAGIGDESHGLLGLIRQPRSADCR